MFRSQVSCALTTKTPTLGQGQRPYQIFAWSREVPIPCIHSSLKCQELMRSLNRGLRGKFER